MKTIFKSCDYVSVIKYLFLGFVFLCFNNLEKSILPYSGAIYVAVLSLGSSLIITSLLYLGCFLISGSVGLLGSQAILCIVSCIVVLIYRKINNKIYVETVICALVGLLGFVFLGDTKIFYTVEKRILTWVLTTALTFLSVIAGKAIVEKGFKFKFGFEEFASLSTILVLFGTGVCNLLTPLVWRSSCALLILLVCYLFRTGIGTLFSSVLGISLALYYNNIIYISIFLFYAIAVESLMPLSRYVSALAILMADYFIQFIFNVYGGYTLTDFISLLVGVLVFCVIPTKLLQNLKETLYSFRERQLVRQSINRNRTMLSGKLFDISAVFSEMSCAFNAFKHNSLTQDKTKSIMQKQILTSTCSDCPNKMRCKQKEKTLINGLSKMIDIGFAKGKISLIDLPKELGDNCVHPNNIIYGLNKLLADYRSYALENANLKSGRDILASQAQGVSEVLRNLAVECSSQLKYQSRIERALANALQKQGFIISELLIFGEGEHLSVSLIVMMKEFSLDALQNLISKHLSMQMFLEDKTEISQDKCYLSFKKATEFDAVYGFAQQIKDGSTKSGDTYSVTRITDDRLLVALSDGMGSGEQAENISSTSLSLIESFYKSGLSSSLILNTVNKLLSINTEDSFTALDMSIIDLKTCSADFIKYGAPYGFIIGEKGIRIVEGNCLPLGIIDELKPSVCKAELCNDDMVLLVTDGISDAFGSSSALIDFLHQQTAKNPQTLADNLLSQAIALNGGAKKDDMTVLAVRIFKRNCD